MPSPPTFVTVPAELQPVAHACYTRLAQDRMSPRCEHVEEHFPESATLYAKRRGEQHFYLIDRRVKDDRVNLWASFGRSCTSATFVVFCFPTSAKFSGDLVSRVRRLGVGLTVVDAAGNLTEIVSAADLSLNVTLPPLSRQAGAVRPELSKIHDAITNGDWKKGFEDACKLTETTARRYLVRQVQRAGPVQVITKGKPKSLTVKAVGRMTLGQLAHAFCNMMAPKLIDSLLCAGLRGINPDRISAAHGLLRGKKEKRLRDNIGRHMWTIHNLLRAVPK